MQIYTADGAHSHRASEDELLTAQKNAFADAMRDVELKVLAFAAQAALDAFPAHLRKSEREYVLAQFTKEFMPYVEEMFGEAGHNDDLIDLVEVD